MAGGPRKRRLALVGLGLRGGGRAGFDFSWPGLANAWAKGERGILLAGHSEMEAVIEAVLFEGAGAVSDIEEGGRVALGGPTAGGHDVGS